MNQTRSERSSAGSLPETLPPSLFRLLLPITSAVFLAFLTIGMALPVLPIHVHDTLHFSSLVVGILMGCQFAVALLSRAWAGGHSDQRGAKHAMVVGLLLAGASGGIYLISIILMNHLMISLAFLLLGRLILGCGESLIVTGALAWSVGLIGRQNAGKVMAWVGMAIYAAYAVGAPIGAFIYKFCGGFTMFSVVAMLFPLSALFTIIPLRRIAPVPSAQRVPFVQVAGSVWLPGLGLSCACMGFGTISAFSALLFSQRGWGSASYAFSSFGIAFILARVFFGGLPDRLGGAKVAIGSVFIEALGQCVMGYTSTSPMALLGSALTGFGYSLAFPAFGVEAVRRTAPESRGVAMGAYVAFMDLALGIAGPALGFVATRFGVPLVFLTGSALVLCSLVIALFLLRKVSHKTHDQLDDDKGTPEREKKQRKTQSEISI